MIKTLIICALIFISGVSSNVYVCMSGTAYAYHRTRDCYGLNKCTHTIKEVKESYAIDSLNRRKCGYCYRYNV